jgi:nicotinamide-nucleotide amidase
MPKAEILTIGTELLLGEIVDTNSPFIARALRDIGIDLYWTSTVGDNEARIAEAVQNGMARSEIIITTGGLGPTVDDPTRNAVARAFGVGTEFRPELWEQIKARFKRFGRDPTENNKRQAYVPEGALAVENPVGTAPAFIVETQKNTVIALPGVSREMEYLMEHEVLPHLHRRFELKGLIKSRSVHTAGIGESQIDALIGDLETLSNPTVGLAAHAGQVDVRITAKADTVEAADAMLGEVEATLRERLGDGIYGVDGETLEAAALTNIVNMGWNLVVVEAGLSGRLTQRLADSEGDGFLGGEVLTSQPTLDELETACRQFRQSRQAQACLGVLFQPGESKQILHLRVLTPESERKLRFSYGGPPSMAPRWATNVSLDTLRRLQAKSESATGEG